MTDKERIAEFKKALRRLVNASDKMIDTMLDWDFFHMIEAQDEEKCTGPTERALKAAKTAAGY